MQRSDLSAVPWDSLDSVSLRGELLLNPEPFAHVKTLDPIRMSPHDIYSVLILLLQAQKSGVRLLEFTIADIVSSDADVEQRVSEPPTASPRDVGIDNAIIELENSISGSDSPIQTLRPAKSITDSTASARDNSTYNEGILQKSALPLQMAPTSAPPVINSPQFTPPLFESVIRAALENAAGAGISDPTAIDPPPVLQHLETASPQIGKAETSNPNPQKRRREEMEPGGRNVKRMKNKVAVPPREQSLR